MDTGQMMAVMQQMPVGVVALQAGEPGVAAGRDGGSFAGLLQGVSLQQADPAGLASQALPLNTVVGKLAGPDMMADTMLTALSTLAGNNGKQLTVLQKDSNAVTSDRSTLQENEDAASQNVMLDLSAAQLGLLISQLQGRMPEAGIVPAGTSDVLRELAAADCAMSGAFGCADLTQIGGNDTMPKVTAVADGVTSAVAALTAGSTVSSHEVAVTTASAQEPVMAQVVGGKESLPIPTAQGSMPPQPQNEVLVTEGDTSFKIKTAVAPGPADTTRLTASIVGHPQPEKTALQARDALQVVTSVPLQHVTLGTRTAEGVTDAVVRSVSVPQPLTMVEQVVLGTENRVLQLEPQVPQNRAAALTSAQAAAQAAARPVSAPTQEAELVALAVPQDGLVVQQEQPQKGRSAMAMAAQPTVVATPADGMVEQKPLRPELGETGKIQQSKTSDTEHGITMVAAGEKQTGSDTQEMPDRGMNENFQTHLLHQQVKSEGSSTVNAASGTAQSDVSRTNPAPEQVVQQVRDRFITHETKQGSEQVVLRLSPEHLGELKVNLNLEGQRLRVEIVAENKMVRDSLMQHTDALKESLSRQNIKMESFDVTTGGNSSTDSGRGQGEWRELAQRRQHNAWMPDGGYRLEKQAAPAVAAYQRRSEHAMVDLHY